MPRQIKPTQIHYESQTRQRTRQKLFDKNIKITKVQSTSRKARIQAMKQKQQIQSKFIIQPQSLIIKTNSKIIIDPNVEIQHKDKLQQENVRQLQHQNKLIENNLKVQKKNIQQEIDNESEEEEEEKQKEKILLKPIFMVRQTREQFNDTTGINDKQRKKQLLKYTTKLLLQQQHNKRQEEQFCDQNMNNESDLDENLSAIVNDKDQDEQYSYELWKIRELKRIRRDQQQHRKYQLSKIQIQRRRKLNNEQILLENKLLGSDATENPVETKYIFLQKYYHKGAFYQDEGNNQLMKRDYNLPTPMQMQDKSMLPQIMQKRNGNFGMKRQSKYTHLTAEDTTDLNPLTRPDQSIMDYWKKKMSGYKNTRNNI